MRVVYHPDFPRDIKQFEKQYRDISERLALRFRIEVDDAIEHIKTSPGSAGHFLNTGSKIVKEVRPTQSLCLSVFRALRCSRRSSDRPLDYPERF